MYCRRKLTHEGDFAALRAKLMEKFSNVPITLITYTDHKGTTCDINDNDSLKLALSGLEAGTQLELELYTGKRESIFVRRRSLKGMKARV